MRISRGLTLVIVIISGFTFLVPGGAAARPEFARFTGNPCSACHISPQGGGPLKPEGEQFRKSLKDLNIPMDPRLRVSTGQRLLHFTLYLLHIPFGVAWVGLFLYAFGSALRKRSPVLPPGPYIRQLIYGVLVVLVTGPLLVATRMKMVPGLFATRFGFLLLVKIAGVSALLVSTLALLWHIKVVLVSSSPDAKSDELLWPLTGRSTTSPDGTCGVEGSIPGDTMPVKT
jgi:hypothetical protein